MMPRVPEDGSYLYSYSLLVRVADMLGFGQRMCGSPSARLLFAVFAAVPQLEE